MTRDYLGGHRSHDYRYLVARWRAVAKRAGLTMQRIARTDSKYPVYAVRSKRLREEGTIYISAGIHGDEPGGTEALISWAEKNTRLLRSRPFLIVPCINPWGLVNNRRTDAQGRDLNRTFQDDSIPEIAAIKRAIGDRRLSLALTLHEDYDAMGIYVYELQGGMPYWGEDLLEAAAAHVPADPRGMIEGRAAVGGLVRAPIRLKIFEKMGLPEAVSLYFKGCPRVFTIETPSEYGLDRRIRAHVAVIEKCMVLLGKPARTKRKSH